jgi:hypothetical protein
MARARARRLSACAAAGAPRRVRAGGHDIAFELDDSKSMIDGVVLTGNVVVTAVYDLDGDVLTREAGDRKGQAKVRVPARDVTIVIDSPR